MNDSTLKALKVLVERAVRPVRASTAHKQKVREELLAHVAEVFADEMAQVGDESAALERTEQRFGNPQELTRHLQQAVTRRDLLRRVHDSMFGFGMSQSTWRRSLRHASAAAILCALAFGLVLGIEAILFPDSLRPWPVLAAATSSFIAGLCVFVAGLLFLAHWMCQTLYGAACLSWLRLMLIVAASSLLLPAITFSICILWTGDARASLNDVKVGGVAALLTPLIVAAMAWRLAKEIRAVDEWASLGIE